MIYIVLRAYKGQISVKDNFCSNIIYNYEQTWIVARKSAELKLR